MAGRDKERQGGRGRARERGKEGTFKTILMTKCIFLKEGETSHLKSSV